MSPKPFTPKVLTANHLLDGDVIYLSTSGAWVTDLSAAALWTDPITAEAKLETAKTQPDVVVGAYLADAKAGPKGPEPVHFREAFRAKGPSNYLHGKQEHHQRAA